MIRWLLLLLFSSLLVNSGLAQNVVTVDLTASSNITKTFTGLSRSGNYCGDNNCVIFNITLNPGSDLVSFNASQVTGASFYSVDCGPLTPIGTAACISGKTSVTISFCKPGGNTNVVYTITASTAVEVSPDATVREGCPKALSVVGLDPASATWTSIYPGAQGAYNSYLSCTSGCLNTTFTAGTNSPAYIDYKVSGTVSSCPNSRSDTVRIYVTPPMSVAFNPGSTVICSGTATTLSTTVTGGSAPYTYSWTRDGTPLSGTSSSISASSIGTYTVTVKDNTDCLPVSQSITVTAAPTPAAPTASGTSICSGSATTLTATAPGGTYAWYDAPSGGNLLITNASYTTPTLTATTTYYVQTVVNGCTSPRTAVTVTVNPIPAAPTASGTTICSGSTATITATAPGGSYQWYDAASGGNLLASNASYITPVLNATTTYYVQTTVNGCTSARKAVTVTVNPTPVAPTAAGTTICSGSTATLTATAPPGGTYEWYDVAAGGTALISGSTFTTPSLTATTTYYVQTTINGCTSARTAVTVTVNPIPAAPTANGATICSGSTTVLTATAPGGTYQWFASAVGGTALFTGAAYTTPALTATTTYYVQTVVNGCTSARTAVTVTVNPIPAAPTASGTTICSGSTATITATAPGGSYEWYDAASGGNLLASNASYTTPVLNATTTYYVQTTVNGCTSARTAVTVTVNPTPAAPTAAGTTICSGSTATLIATAPPGGTYEWYDVAIGGLPIISGSTFTTPSLTATTTYYVQTTINGCTSARTAVTVTVNPIPAAPTAAGATICSGSTTVLTATAPGGTYQWFASAVGGTALFTGAAYTTPALTATTTYYVQTTVNGCTSARTAVTVTVNPIPVAPTASGTTICSGSTATITATAPGGSYEWYDAASGGNLLASNASYTTPVLNATTTYYVQTTINGCTGARTAVTVTVNPTPAAPTAVGTTICSGSSASLNATAPGGTYEWYDAASGGNLLNSDDSFTTPILTATTTYYVQTTINGCTGPRTAVTVTVNPLPVAPTASGATVCGGSTATLTATAPGPAYRWYSAATGGTLLATTASYTTPALSVSTTYYVEAVSASGCAGPRTAVTASVIPADNPAFYYSSGTFCTTGADPTPTVVSPSGGTFSSSAGLVINPSTGEIDLSASALGTYTINFVTNTACLYSSSSSITITSAPDATFSYAVDFCQGQSGVALPTFPPGASAGLFSSTDPGIVFRNASTGEINLQASTPGTYMVTNNIAAAGGCAAADFSASVTIKPTPVVTSAATATLCNNIAQNYNITSDVLGTTFIWNRAAVTGISNTAATGQPGDTITETLVNTTPAPIDVVYTILPSANGCDGPVFTYTVTVNPTPTVTSAATATLCNSTVQNYTITGDVAGTTFVWSRAAVTGISNTAVTGQASSNITETLTNTTATPIAVTYVIIPSANGCDGPAFTYTVTVNPTPTVTSAATASICNSTAQNYTITGNVTGSTFVWSRAAVTGISNGAVVGQAGNSITESLTNTTAAPINVSYTIIPSANGCSGPAFTYTITVNPTPIVTSASSATICNNTAQNYTITGNVTGTTFVWSRAAVTGISNGAVVGQAGSSITETLVNTSSAPVDVVYTIVPSANTCDGPTFTYTVTVNPTPTVTSAATASICNSTAQNYAITSAVAGTTFIWSRTAVTGISNPAVAAQTGNSITETLVNTTSAPIDVSYIILPSANGCDGPAFTYTVKVNPRPVVNSAASATVCSNTAQNYTITSAVAGTTFVWSRAAVPGISNAAEAGQASNNITETLVNTTAVAINVSYVIIPSANGCSGPAFTYTVTVNPTPMVTSVATATICNSTAQNYIITGNVSGTTFVWSRAAVTGISNSAVIGQAGNTISETLINTGTVPIDVAYVIIPSANGCSGPAFTHTVTVNPTPMVTSAATATICNGTIQNYAITANVTGTTFTWGRAAVTGISNSAVAGQTSSTINEVLQNTTSAPINVAYIIVPSANGCNGPAFTYTVTINPTPVVTSASTAITCNNTAQNYAITSNVTGTTFVWSRAAVTGISNGAVAGQAGNTITETLTNTTAAPIDVTYVIIPSANGCDGPAFTYTITVNPTPTVTSAATASICNSTTQNYTITGNVSGTTFVWSRATVTGISNSAVTGQAGNTITESLTNTTAAPINVSYTIIPSANGCSGPPFTYTITVNPTPIVTSATSATVCNSTVQNYAITGNATGTTFVWSRAAVTGISNSAVIGQSGSTIAESLTNTTTAPINVVYVIIPSANGCSGPAFSYTVTVNPTPVVTSAATATSCNSTAQNYTITGNVSGTTFVWSRAVVTGISNPAVAGQNGNSIIETLVNTTAAPINVSYTIIPSANGCSGPIFTYTITVNPTPTVTSAAAAALCNSTAQNYAITSDVAGTTFVWSRAAVTGISNPAVAGQNGNSITETLDNTTSAPISVAYVIIPSANGCDGPAFTYTVNVNPTPTVTSAATATICNSTAQNYAITSDVAGATFVWSRVAVTGISNAQVNGQAGNSITETLVNTTSAPINVVYTIIPSANGCDGPAFTYAVTVNPTPTVTSAATATICNSTAQNYAITGDVAGTTFVWSRAAVTGISNAQVNGQAGNSITETLINTTSAPINVVYTIIPSANGCDGPAFTYTVTVNPTPTVTSAATATICNSTAQNYAITSAVAGATFVWSRTAVPGISNTAVSGQAGGNITESLTNTTAAPINVVYTIIPSANGCDGPVFTYTVTVNPTPTVTSAATATICNSTAQNYAITSDVAGTTFVWSRAAVTGISNAQVNGQAGNSITETLVNTTSAPINVVYTIIPSANGCDGPAFTYAVTVNPTPTVTSAATATICNSTAQNYAITSAVTGTTFVWSRAVVTGISNPAVAGQTGNSILETLVNTTSAPINVIYTIIPSANGCDGPAFTYTVTVNPTPTVTSAATATICNSTAQNYAITSDVAGATFVWSRATVTGISNSAVTGQAVNSITETLVNTTSAPINVIYTIIPSANGCDGPAFTYTVTVNPTPTVTSAATATICNSTAQNYAITANVTGTTFTRGRAAVTGISNPAVAGQNGNSIVETLVNITSAPINVAYVIVPSANGCDGPAFTYTVTVNPTPTVTSAATATICNSTAQNYAITSDVAGATFVWSRTAVPGISNTAVSGQSGNSITETLDNTTSAPINVAYVIVPSATGCDGPAFTYTVTVNPTPTVTSAATATICNSTAQNYAITSDVAGATFVWSRTAVPGISNTAVSGQTGNSITETLVNTTSAPISLAYVIVPSANGCDGPVFTYTVNVNPTPTVTSAATATICNSTAQNYAITSDVAGATFVWSRATVTGISNAQVNGQAGSSITETLVNTTAAPINVIYTIIPSANGCSGPIFTYTITVNPTPTVTSAAAAALCNSTAQNYAITSDVAGTTFVWSRAAVTGISNLAVAGQNGNSITETLVNITSAPINVVYTIIPSANGCDGPTFTYTVTVNPTPTVTSAATATICNSTAQNYAITSDVAGTTFVWSRAVVTGISNPAVAGQKGNSITETLANTTSAPINVAYVIVPSANGCDGPAFTYTVTVNPTPTVTSAATAAICNSTAQNYAITSAVTGTTFVWSRTAVTGISNAQVNGQAGNSITETLINTTSAPINVIYTIIPSANGCDGPAFKYTVTVNPTPTVTSAATATICNSTAQNYAITSAVAGATFVWSRTSVTGISNPGVIGQAGNSITETLNNTTVAPIKVSYTIIPSFNGCDGPAFTYTITVNPTPRVTSATTATLCNSTQQQYTLTSNVTGTTFVWSRIAVTGISNPAVAGQNGNSITETLVNTTSSPIQVAYRIVPSFNGCDGPAFTYTVTVNPTPRITNTRLSETICSTTSSTAVFPTSNVAGVTFRWTAIATSGITGYLATGTGTIPAQILTNSAPGSGKVTYTIIPSFGGCDGIPSNYTIEVLNNVPVSPIAKNSGPVCLGQSLTLSAESVANATYSWTGPNGFTSNLQNPVISSTVPANEGLYTVTITVGECSSSANTVVVLNKPAVVTVRSDLTVCASNGPIQIAGLVSGGSTTGIWSTNGSGTFPSGATALNGTYVLSAADKASGNITLTLTATNTASCAATSASLHITVTPAPIVFAGDDQNICSLDQVLLKGQSTGTDVNWTSSGSGTFSPNSTSLNASYTPSDADRRRGSITLTLTTGSTNCLPVSDQMTVNLVPAPIITLDKEVYVFEGESITLNPEVDGNDLQYLWSPNTFLNNNTLKNPTFTGTSNVKYTLTVRGTAGCTTTANVLVKVLQPIKIPNSITPNGDGINDTWHISGLENYPGVTISVYNRYGVLLYRGYGLSSSWDGKYNGSDLPVGVYYYVISFAKFSKPLTGSITIIR